MAAGLYHFNVGANVMGRRNRAHALGSLILIFIIAGTGCDRAPGTDNAEKTAPPPPVATLIVATRTPALAPEAIPARYDVPAVNQAKVTASRPTTEPAALTIAEAQARLATAERKADGRLNQNWAYVSAAGDVRRAEEKTRGSGVEDADRLALANARLKLAKVRADLYARDQDIRIARLALDAAVHASNLAKARAKEAERAAAIAKAEEERKATESAVVAAAPAESTLTPAYGDDAYGGSYSGASGATSHHAPGTDVHVGGYTRKDGTYVHSYSRSSPGSGGGHGRR